MAAEWFYQVEGKQVGPVEPAELRRLATAGIVTPDTMVKRGVDGAWVRAETVKGLFRRSESPSTTAAGRVEGPPLSRAVASPVEKGLPPLPSPPSLPPAPRSILKRQNEQFQRLTPLLLMVAVGLMVVSVILQGIMCAAVLSFLKQSTYRGLGSLRGGVPVQITNYEVPVKITNHEVPVNVRNHYIIEGDPIPVTIVR